MHLAPILFKYRGRWWESKKKAGEMERMKSREKRRKEFSMWAVIRGNQQGGQGGSVGSEQSTTKQPFSSLVASLRGASQAYLSSRLLNRLTSGSHPAHTRSHTLSSAWFPQTQRNHDLAAASLTTLTFSLTSRSNGTGWTGASTQCITRTFTSSFSPLFSVELCWSTFLC